MNAQRWDGVERAFRGIFERGYFANNGPLVQSLDAELAQRFRVHDAVCVTNESVAVMCAARALSLQGEIVVPSLCDPRALAALELAGMVPVAAAVDARGLLSPQKAAAAITARTSALFAADLWDRECERETLAALARQHGLKVMFDASERFGVPLSGDAQILSFHQNAAVNAGQGGCVLTADPGVGAKLRTIRNFAASQTFAPVPLRLNAKMSEAQAALALESLLNLDEAVTVNKNRYDLYARGLQGIAGMSLIQCDPDSTYRHVMLEIDEDRLPMGREAIRSALAAAGAAVELPAQRDATGTVSIGARVLKLPAGPHIGAEDIASVCERLRIVAESAA